MGAGVNRPDVWFGLAMNRDPNDAVISPLWSDWTANLLSVSGLERGQNFELDQAMAAEPQLSIRDLNEYLNPANPSSPYAGLVQPYREACLLAQWPNTPVGGNVNLINTGTWRGNKIDVFDPTFESYTTGAPAPNWVTAIGGISPIVASTAPFQGSRHLRYTQAATNVRQGVAWPVACIPGRQYTCSAYVFQGGASTLQLRVTDQSLATDQWRRTVVAGAGTADLGGAYTIISTAADYGVTWDGKSPSGIFSINPSATNSGRYATVDMGSREQDNAAYCYGLTALPVGGVIRQGVTSNYTDASNNYMGYLEVGTDGTCTAVIARRVAGATTPMITQAIDLNPLADFYVEMTSDGQSGTGYTQTFNLYVWQATGKRPSTPTTTITDANTAGTRGGLFALRIATTPLALQFGPWQCDGAVESSTMGISGSYQRMSVTWTATQPYHTIRLGNQGTAVAGNVNVDAIQHEQGSSASTFTNLGPVIYPVFRNNMERPIRSWTSSGFEGIVSAPCLDAFAQLAAIDLETEYAQAVLNLSPDFYWRLNDGEQTLQFADTSGNNGPPLMEFVSKYGAGTSIQPGAQTGVVGDPGGTGVTITAMNAGGTGSRPGNALGVGASIQGSPQLTLPAALGGSWSMSFVAWINATANPTVDASTIISLGRTFPTSYGVVNPIWLKFSNTTLDLIVITGAAGGVATVLSFPSNIPGSGWRHIACTITQSGSSLTATLYRDGINLGSTTNASAGALPVQTNTLTLGCDNIGETAQFMNGTIAHAAFWNRDLSDTDIFNLARAGIFGAPINETPSARIARHLALGGFIGSTRIGGGTTTMQAPTYQGKIDLLSDSQASTVADQGRLWTAPDGAVVFEGRLNRWQRLSPVVTFGENFAGSEIPYNDDVKLDPDPFYVVANVTVERNNGGIAVGGLAADIATATRRFFPRSFSAGGDFATDAQAQDMADFIFYTHNGVMLRISTLTIDPSANPALWPVALSLECGQRVRFVRRASAANGGLGLTITLDFFVEKVGHPVMNFETGEWKVAFELSPINAGGSPTMQPWILEDPTLSVLGSTTMLGW